jgi:multicomponent Na+:H+ antiporter subunit G
MQLLLEILAAIALLGGSFLMVVSGIGLVRFPDVFCRMHAAGKAGTLGIVFTLLGTMIIFIETDRSVFFRGCLAVFFQFLTTPAATHLLARAAYIRDYPLSDRTAVDELEAVLPSIPDEAVGGQE